MVTFSCSIQFPVRANPRRYRPALRVAVCTLLPLFAGACGGTDYRPYPYFQRVEVVTAAGGVAIPPAQSRGDIAGNLPEATAAGVAVGTGAGLGLSLLCGPMFTTCAEVIVPLTVGTELVAAPATAGVAILTGMSREEADQVIAYFEALPGRRDLNRELVDAVSAELPADRIATAGGDARLALGIQEIRTYQNLDRTFSFHLTVAADMAWKLGTEHTEEAQRSYNCYTVYLAVDAWLADGGHSLDEAITQCIDQVAGQVNNALMNRKKPAAI